MAGIECIESDVVATSSNQNFAVEKRSRGVVGSRNVKIRAAGPGIGRRVVNTSMPGGIESSVGPSGDDDIAIGQNRSSMMTSCS